MHKYLTTYYCDKRANRAKTLRASLHINSYRKTLQMNKLSIHYKFHSSETD